MKRFPTLLVFVLIMMPSSYIFAEICPKQYELNSKPLDPTLYNKVKKNFALSLKSPYANQEFDISNDIRTLEELEAKLITPSNKPTLVFVYANWSTNSKIIANGTLKNKNVINKLLNYNLINIDVTEHNIEHINIFKKYNFVNVPSFILFNKDGSLLRINESKCIEPVDFISWLKEPS